MLSGPRVLKLEAQGLEVTKLTLSTDKPSRAFMTGADSTTLLREASMLLFQIKNLPILTQVPCSEGHFNSRAITILRIITIIHLSIRRNTVTRRIIATKVQVMPRPFSEDRFKAAFQMCHTSAVLFKSQEMVTALTLTNQSTAQASMEIKLDITVI